MQNDLVERLERAFDPFNPVFRHDRDEAGKLAIAEIRRLKGLVEELADELEGELNARYDRMLDHPAMKVRYDRDMMTVVKARATLSRLEPQIEGEGLRDPRAS